MVQEHQKKEPCAILRRTSLPTYLPTYGYGNIHPQRFPDMSSMALEGTDRRACTLESVHHGARAGGHRLPQARRGSVGAETDSPALPCFLRQFRTEARPATRARCRGIAR
jgi:hypothetical protein